MEGCLGDEAVGKGNPQKTCDASGKAKEKDVPVKPCGFAEGKFGSLGNER